MKQLEWILIQSIRYPSKEKKSGHTETPQGHMHTEQRPCEDRVRWPVHVKGSERPQEKPNLPSSSWIPASRTARKYISDA